MHREHRGLLYAVLAALSNAVCALFIKWAAVISNEEIVFWRFFIALIFVLPGVFRGRVYLHIKQFPKHLMRGIAGIGAIYCFFYSVKKLPLVEALTLFNTAPLFLPLIVFVWLKMIIPKMRLVALVIGFIGVMIALHSGLGLGRWPMLVGLLGAFLSALAQVGVRQLTRTEPPATIMTYYFIISVIIAFPFLLLSWTPFENPMLWVYLLLIGMSSLIFQYFLVKSLTDAPVTKVGTLTYTGIVFSGLFGWWFFNEIPSLWTTFGALLIILGGLLALFSKEPPRRRKGYQLPPQSTAN